MEHLGTKALSTERLILRPFTLADASAMCRNWAGDPEVSKYLTWPTHTSEAVSAAVLADWVPRYAQPDWYQWAIVPKDFGEPIGSIAVVRFDDQVLSAHIGYCIGQRWWRKGYTGEALAEVLRFLWRSG